eukprot:763752-Hanusia_phi.AAC.1
MDKEEEKTAPEVQEQQDGNEHVVHRKHLSMCRISPDKRRACETERAPCSDISVLLFNFMITKTWKEPHTAAFFVCILA